MLRLVLLSRCCLRKSVRNSTVLAVQGDKLTLKVNKLSSTKTQLPYDYYSIPYCRPEAIVSSAENLGEVLRGDRIENSLYEVNQRSVLYHQANVISVFTFV